MNPALSTDLIDRLIASARGRAPERLADRADLSPAQVHALTGRGESGGLIIRSLRLRGAAGNPGGGSPR
ncbi:MAG: hypothetical protein QOI78_8010 [Actinomycetota bacterium]|nr:hypothetical protein [Actinomycetota bacterium]